jgi:protein-L-isoaspartate O-methyltransferase
VSLQRSWDKRVEGWDSHVTSAAAFGEVRDRLLRAARPAPGDACADLGAGTGFVTLALAPLVESVLAVDISPAMARHLAGQAASAGLGNDDSHEPADSETGARDLRMKWPAQTYDFRSRPPAGKSARRATTRRPASRTVEAWAAP